MVTQELANEIFVVEFVSKWNYSDKYQDILHGFGNLVVQVSFLDQVKCQELIK